MSAVVFSFSPAHGIVPTKLFEDTDENWLFFLKNPQTGPKAGSCIRSAVFRHDAIAPTILNVGEMHGALFDLDEGVVPSPDHIVGLLEKTLGGARFILWTTYNHTPEEPRYRLYVPYARPVEPAAHKWVWTSMAKLTGLVLSPSQANVDRLGYLPRLKNADEAKNYMFALNGRPEDRLDPYTRFGDGTEFAEDVFVNLDFTAYEARDATTEPNRDEWLDDHIALDRARAYFRNVGPEIKPGSRHMELFKVGCKLWWDFWLEYDHVREILMSINDRFPEPKARAEVIREVEASFARTRGNAAVVQRDDDGEIKEAGCARKKQKPVSHAELEHIAKRAKRSNDFNEKEIGDFLLRLLPSKQGTVVVLAPKDRRDAALRMCAKYLANEFPKRDPESIASLFADSIGTTDAQHPWEANVELVVDIVRRTQNFQAKLAEAEENERGAARRRLIEMATHGRRSEPYTQEEIQNFADANNVDVESWAKRWTVVVGNAHYIFVNGDYSKPVNDRNFALACLERLSPAPVVLKKTSKDGERVLLTRNEILERHGTVADDVVVDLTAQQSYYDQSTGIFHEATCPLRTDIEAERVPIVEDWLNSFPDTDAREKFFQWLSWSVNLEEQLPALYLCGPPASGKTLLGFGLAQLYPKKAPTELGMLFEDFNESVARCPILVGDETLPGKLQGKNGTDIFRQVTLAQQRPLKRKFLSTSVMKGHLRFLFTANNDRLLPRSNDITTEQDSEAIRDRLIFLDFDEGPTNFLAKLTPEQRDAFRSDALIAKHILWMRDNRGERGEGRSPVEGASSRVTERIDFQGIRGDVLLWVYTALIDNPSMLAVSGGFGDDGPLLVPFIDTRTNTTHVGVNFTVLRNTWQGITKQKRELKSNDLVDALSSIKISQERTRPRKNDNPKRYFVIDTKYVARYAKFIGSDPVEVWEAIDALSEKLVARPFKNETELKLVKNDDRTPNPT